jgi:hypothetical protein
LIHGEEKKVIWAAWAVIIGIIGPIMSFVGPNLIQEIFLKNGRTLYIFTPTIANILFFVAVVFFVFYCVFMYFGKKLIIWSIASLLVGLALIYFSSNHYMIITKDQFAEKPLLAFEKVSYKWEDIENSRMVITNIQDGIGNLVITFNDGYVMEFERNKYLLENLKMIERLFRENNIDYKLDIKVDQETASN